MITVAFLEYDIAKDAYTMHLSSGNVDLSCNSKISASEWAILNSKKANVSIDQAKRIKAILSEEVK
tara:strand:+ start:384 stop:581 length:198 start_codon:yes stop_codon:yes gene_type:complete